MFAIDETISEAQVDNSYHHLHHADSLKLLELARIKLLDHIGFPLEAFIKRQLFLVVSSLQVEYRRELFAGAVRITCQEARAEKKKISIAQNIFNQKGKIAVSARVELSCLSGLTKRAIDSEDAFVQSLLTACNSSSL